MNLGSTQLSLLVIFSLSSMSPAKQSDDIRTTIPHDPRHHPGLITDGKPDTWFRSSRGIKKEETITFRLAAVVSKGKTVIVRDGNTNGKEQFKGAVLEGSLDGTSWKILARHRADTLCATLTRPLRHLRLRATRNIGHQVTIREIQTVDVSPLLTNSNTIELDGKRIPLSLTVDTEQFQDLKPRFMQMSEVYFDAWPKLVKMLGSPRDETHRDVNIVFRAKMKHPAHALGDTITVSASHLRRDPADTVGVFIHELTHVIQRYRGPSWFVEGVADYTRYKLHGNDAWAKRCRRHIPYNRPFGHYWASAAFLLYLEDTYKKPIVRTVSMAMRNKKYNEALWKQITGKALTELAADYKTSGWKPVK